MSRALVVATHNLMEGLFLPALCAHHVGLRDEVGLDILCLQENRRADGGGMHAERVATSLGAHYSHLGEDPESGVAVVYDRRRAQLLEWELFPLPAVTSMSWLERAVILDGRPHQTKAMLAVFEADGPPFAVVCLHLDTVGGTEHRAAQARAIADHLAARRLSDRFVACGDTNAFALRAQPGALAEILAPFEVLGASDPETAPTHFFARQNEPKVPHQVAVALGRVGLDLPMRYDIVCTNLPVVDRGQRTTPESDHDLVWARLG